MGTRTFLQRRLPEPFAAWALVLRANPAIRFDGRFYGAQAIA